MVMEHERRSHVLAPEDQLGELERDLAIVDHFGDGSCNTTGSADPKRPDVSLDSRLPERWPPLAPAALVSSPPPARTCHRDRNDSPPVADDRTASELTLNRLQQCAGPPSGLCGQLRERFARLSQDLHRLPCRHRSAVLCPRRSGRGFFRRGRRGRSRGGGVATGARQQLLPGETECRWTHD